MKILVIVALVLIFIITITIFLTVNFSYDVINNSGKIKVCLFKIIPIFISNISVVGEYLNFSKYKNKTFQIKLDYNDSQVVFFRDVFNNLIKKIQPVSLNFNSLLALENPMLACLGNGYLNVFVCVVFSYISAKCSYIKLGKNIKTGFRQTDFRFNIIFATFLRLYDFIWAYYKAARQRGMRENEKAKNSK